MTSGDSSRRPVTGKNTEWMIPSDQMIIRRYKTLRHFADTLENGFRAGQAEGYEQREGQTSEPAREHERQRSERTESMILNNGEEMDLASGIGQAREATLRITMRAVGGSGRMRTQRSGRRTQMVEE
jgi:hypothetical protein